MIEDRISFIINLAGLNIEVRVAYEGLRSVCGNYMAEEGSIPDLVVDVTHDDIVAEEIRSTGVSAAECTCTPNFESTALFRKIADRTISLNVTPIHGSAISVDNEGYIFMAPSGTGKSTHTSLWREYFGERAMMINDDKPLLKIDDDQILVCGSPWNGKHRLGENISVPLKAFCFLERSENNSIKRMSQEEAFEYIYKQIYHPDDFELMGVTMDLVSKLLDRIPVYKMGVNNFKDDAVRVSYEGMR